jgi:hypothetical protein
MPWTFDTGDKAVCVAAAALMAVREGSMVDSGGSATEVAAETSRASSTAAAAIVKKRIVTMGEVYIV